MNYTEKYYANGATKLHKMVDKILITFGGIYDKDKDDFYSVANETFVDVLKRYDDSKDFDNFLYSCLANKIRTEITARNRQKRQADRLATSLDAPLSDEDDLCLLDTIASKNSVDNELEKTGIYGDEKVEKYLQGLSKKAREIVEMRMDDIPVNEIKQKLNLSDKTYERYMDEARKSEDLALFVKNANDGNYKKEKGKGEKEMCMVNAEMMDVMDMEFADNYRMDKNNLYSLLESFGEGEINRKYILQRKMYQWVKELINKYLSRILNNQPIPEIVICEQVINGNTIKWLIDGLQRLSYAEAFKENRIAIGAEGAEYTKIRYREYILDEDGHRILDEYGAAKYEIKIFDIVGKKYKDLPEFLKKRFNNFNINVTTFFNCTSEQIAYHIRNYNNHQAMSKTQYAVTSISEDTAKKIKTLSEKHAFFKDCGKYSNKNKTNGDVDRIVADGIMTINYLQDWKKTPGATMKFVNTNATQEQFDTMEGYLDRLYEVYTDDAKEFFNNTNSHIWFALFDRFVKKNVGDDSKFFEFAKAFKEELHLKPVNGKTWDEYVTDNRSSKDKKVVIEKIEMLECLLDEFLHIEKEYSLEKFEIKDERIKNFVEEFCESRLVKELNCSENEKQKLAVKYLMITENYDYVKDTDIQNSLNNLPSIEEEILDGLLLNVDMFYDWIVDINKDEPVLRASNIPTLLSFVNYANGKELDVEAQVWFLEFVKEYENAFWCDSPVKNYNNMVAWFEEEMNKVA